MNERWISFRIQRTEMESRLERKNLNRIEPEDKMSVSVESFMLSVFENNDG